MNVDVETAHHDLFAGHFFIGDTRQTFGWCARNERP
jgi:hypothetical protein